ncbi:hypothetical protein [Kingella negevensis]|uniref:hypothetical protein n=1 Tax=Kingella negevensis TaxID=1522312 RepID=UPI00254B86F3|nr:hypothetical protein [Kingella negevensis]MDK4689662.1 hypothetical protein [Kingella negevensis]
MNSLKTKNNTVYFPERLTHHTVAELCQEIDFICQQCQSKQIYFDAQNFKFIDAFSMTVLFNCSNYGLQQRQSSGCFKTP